MAEVVQLDPSCVWQPDMAQAVVTALRNAPRNSRMMNEHAGVIFQNADGEYCYSTLAKGTKDNFEFKIARRPSDKLAALFHNHPGEEDHAMRGVYDKHSPGDLETANKLNIPSFIMTPRGLSKYDPTNAKQRVEGKAMRLGLLGEQIYTKEGE